LPCSSEWAIIVFSSFPRCFAIVLALKETKRILILISKVTKVDSRQGRKVRGHPELGGIVLIANLPRIFVPLMECSEFEVVDLLKIAVLNCYSQADEPAKSWILAH
jgi:hypothetical protein